MKIPKTWKSNLYDLNIVLGSDIQEVERNTLRFSLIGVNVSVGELVVFLEESRSRYKYKLNGISGLFYCWFDEMSSMIQMSFSSSLVANDLPFDCDLQLVGLKKIVNQALNSQYLEGIPFKEMKETSWDEEEKDERFVLEVYVSEFSQ